MKFNVMTVSAFLATFIINPVIAQQSDGKPVYTPEENVVKPVLTQVDGYHRFMLGDVEVTALYDGYVDVRKDVFTKHTKLTESQINRLLNDGFSTILRGGGISTPVNAYLLNTGKNVILIDAGAGSQFGNKVGFVEENLKKAGYSPEQVDVILPTHLHFDHFNGVTKNGKAVFPNATIYIANQEKRFWLDTPLNEFPEAIRKSAQLRKDTLAPYEKAGKVKYYDAGREVIPNVLSIISFGHTPGHVGFELTSKGETLFLWGDILHHHAIQFTVPEVSVEFDSNPEEARASRLKLLADVAKRRIWVAGAHLPFPGIGHVRAESGEKYSWIPLEYGPIETDE